MVGEIQQNVSNEFKGQNRSWDGEYHSDYTNLKEDLEKALEMVSKYGDNFTIKIPKETYDAAVKELSKPMAVQKRIYTDELKSTNNLEPFGYSD